MLQKILKLVLELLITLEKLLQNYDSYSPSKYFWNNHGKQNTGVELRDFLLSNLSGLTFTKNSTKYINMNV